MDHPLLRPDASVIQLGLMTRRDQGLRVIAMPNELPHTAAHLGKWNIPNAN
jgi:hypothetical protein